MQGRVLPKVQPKFENLIKNAYKVTDAKVYIHAMYSLRNVSKYFSTSRVVAQVVFHV